MRKTYFVPMMVLSGLLLLCAVATAVIWQMSGSMYEKENERFEAEYKEPRSYQALYNEALDLRKELSFEKNDKGGLMYGVDFTLGIVLLWWGLDRRRLVKKLNRMEEEMGERKSGG